MLLFRALLIAAPFILWFAWRAWAKHTGRPMGSTPWGWLLLAGGLLLGLSLIATVIFHPDNRGAVYVPGEVGPDGRVTRGHFEKPVEGR